MPSVPSSGGVCSGDALCASGGEHALVSSSHYGRSLVVDAWRSRRSHIDGEAGLSPLNGFFIHAVRRVELLHEQGPYVSLLG